MILVIVGLVAFTVVSQTTGPSRYAGGRPARGAHGSSGLRGWLPPPTREPEPGNAGGGIDMNHRHHRRGDHRRRAARPARRSRRSPATPRSSPPTAASTTPGRPAWIRPSSSATSTRSRRSDWRGRRSTPTSSAIPSTRGRRTPSWPSPTPPRWRRSGSCSSPARATASTTPSPHWAHSALRSWRRPARSRRGGAATSCTSCTGRGTVELDLPAGTTFSVLAMHGPCAGVTVSGARWPLEGESIPPLVGLGVSNQVADPPAVVGVEDGIVTVIVPGAAS